MSLGLQEQLRTFYLTGKGLEALAPEGPLRLAGWQDAPQVASDYPFASRAVPLMYAAAVASTRRSAREALGLRVRQMRQKMADLLATGANRAGRSPEALAEAMGAEAKDLLDAGALALAVARTTKDATALAPERRSRIEKAEAVLARFGRDWETAPGFWLFHTGPEPPGVTAVDGRPIHAGDALAAAARFCLEMLESFTEVLRALRVARLEANAHYVADLHDERVARLDWRSAEAGELAGMPAVAALVTSLEGLNDVVRRGLPVHVLVPCEGLEGADLGSIAMAYRETFVVQETLSRPEPLMRGLKGVAGQVACPAVAVVAVPADGGDEWQAVAALERSRAFPVFRYDPARGDTWAARFELDRSDLDTGVTPAEAAALLARWRAHFRVIAEADWNVDQTEWPDYLAKYAEQAPLAIPYLWVTDARGGRQRAVMTRELATMCRDRLGAYRLLEEMAGVGSPHVVAAVAKVKTEMEASAAAREEAALNAGRQEGARSAVNRLVTALTSLQAPAVAPASPPSPVVPLTASATPTSRPREASPAPGASPAPRQPAAVEDAAADPYIDTFLCTSCNDCMKVNPRLFLYNSDKQAYLGDLSTGTFADLVKGAEGCPARCIHPGSPRPGDRTATPALVARAAKFNTASA